MKDTTLQIYETFSSIQGESSHAGKRCFFIRLAGCPLRCAWCDTKKARSFDSGKPYTVPELVKLAGDSGIPLVEVTGGEPLAQKGTPELCQALLEAGLGVLVETSGSEDISALPEGVIRILDYKTPSSGEEMSMLTKNFTALRPCDEVKFVIADRRDYECAKSVLQKFRLAEQISNILFSPAFGLADGQKLVEWILADQLPVRINLQFHKIIWGPEREGV